jgi:hypothetical protein
VNKDNKKLCFGVAIYHILLLKPLRASPAVGVKVAIQKVPISTLTTSFLKNTQTIISIPLFIFFK